MISVIDLLLLKPINKTNNHSKNSYYFLINQKNPNYLAVIELPCAHRTCLSKLHHTVDNSATSKIKNGNKSINVATCT